MKKNEIIAVVAEQYDNLTPLSREELLEKCEDPKTLRGIRQDVIGKASEYLFFVGTQVTKKSKKRIRAIIEVSQLDAEINVLHFSYV